MRELLAAVVFRPAVLSPRADRPAIERSTRSA
jgi:hypothetical protein